MISLGPKEKVVGSFRAHFSRLLWSELTVLILIILPYLSLPLVPEEVTLGPIGPIKEAITVPVEFADGFLLFALSAWTLLLWFRMFYIFSNHYLNPLILTNDRLIDVSPGSFFARRAKSIRFDMIDSIEASYQSRLGKLFKSGSIQILTSGGIHNIVRFSMARPEHIKERIEATRTRAKETSSGVEGVVFDEEESISKMLNR